MRRQSRPVHNYFHRREGGYAGYLRAGDDARTPLALALAAGMSKKFNVAESYI